MKEIRKTIVYGENEAGVPFVEAPDNLKVYMSLSEDEVLIEGNKRSLEFLATVLVSVCDKQGFHKHIDSETYPGFRGGGKVLTIAHLDKP